MELHRAGIINCVWVSEKELCFKDDGSAEIVDLLINACNEGKIKLRKEVRYVLEGESL